jgi:hypothetical protein
MNVVNKTNTKSSVSNGVGMVMMTEPCVTDTTMKIVTRKAAMESSKNPRWKLSASLRTRRR